MGARGRNSLRNSAALHLSRDKDILRPGRATGNARKINVRLGQHSAAVSIMLNGSIRDERIALFENYGAEPVSRVGGVELSLQPCRSSVMHFEDIHGSEHMRVGLLARLTRNVAVVWNEYFARNRGEIPHEFVTSAPLVRAGD